MVCVTTNRTMSESESEPDPEEIREQLVEAFQGAAYPVTNPMEFMPALPDGPATTVESGEFSVSIGELEAATDDTDRFPYYGPEAVADDLVDVLWEDGELPR